MSPVFPHLFGTRVPFAWLVAGRSSPGKVLLRGIYAASLLAALASKTLASDGAALANIFDPDLADVKPSDALSNAIKQGQKGIECYPPRIKMIVVDAGSGDQSFDLSLAKARADALSSYLSAAGFTPDQFAVSWTLGTVDSVLATYDELSTDKDSEAPKFKVLHSEPPKGAKVKPGDTIKVTILASERYVDGHKSWPTGVRATQLREAQAGLIHSEDYGQKPSPCTLAPFEATYTVPSDPPPIVRLIARTEDGVGNAVEEEADFPTDHWEGTWRVSYRKHIDGGNFPWEFVHIDDELSAQIIFSVGADGSVQGWSKDATVSYRLADDGCFKVQTGSCVGRCKGNGEIPATAVELKITGHKTGDSFHLNLATAQPGPSLIKKSTCVGEAGTQVIKSPPIDWFCSTADPSRPCSGSGHFLQVDIPAENGASKPLTFNEIGGGERGSVTIFHTSN